MNNLEFRAWDSEANIMIYSDHRTRKLYDAYYGFEMNEKGELECRWEGDFTESKVLDGGILDNIMQSTGLKDKNGVEIYEGDIITTDLERNYLIVEYRNGAFMLNCNDGLEDYYDIFFGTSEEPTEVYKYGEVIGNIYENKELLENE